MTQPQNLKKQDSEEKLNNWKGKAIHGQYLRQTEDKEKINTWKMLRKSNLKEFTDVLICSVQEYPLRTNHVKLHIDKTAELPLYQLFTVGNKAVSHNGS